MKWKEYVNAFGLGHRIGIDLPSEDGGNIPDTASYDKEYNHSWNSCTMVTMGIGQDKMEVTPLQMANAMCIVANKGSFFTPHFVKSIDGHSQDDTVLDKFSVKHEVLTHIPDDVYEDVISGMQDVTEIGTASAVRIPGINMCAKTGTAENYLTVDHRRTKLRNNAIFVCFAPRENPKIAIAVVVQNAGFGAVWAAPIGSLLVEKYLNDSLRPESQKKAEEVANADLVPKYLVRVQFLQDSTNAARHAIRTHDSSSLMKYIIPSSRAALLDTFKKVTILPRLSGPSIKQNMLKPKDTAKVIKPDSTR
jgi:penicillin-binding protein 2